MRSRWPSAFADLLATDGDRPRADRSAGGAAALGAAPAELCRARGLGCPRASTVCDVGQRRGPARAGARDPPSGPARDAGRAPAASDHVSGPRRSSSSGWTTWSVRPGPRRGAARAMRSFDVVTSRAVAPLDRLARWSLPLVAPGGLFLAMKGSSAPTRWPGPPASSTGSGVGVPASSGTGQTWPGVSRGRRSSWSRSWCPGRRKGRDLVAAAGPGIGCSRVGDPVVDAGIGWPLLGARRRQSFPPAWDGRLSVTIHRRNEGYPQMSADDASVSRETAATATAVDLATSRCGTAAIAQPAARCRTAADHDGGRDRTTTTTTPIARAVLHQLLAREGRAMSAPGPAPGPDPGHGRGQPEGRRRQDHHHREHRRRRSRSTGCACW